MSLNLTLSIYCLYKAAFHHPERKGGRGKGRKGKREGRQEGRVAVKKE